MRIFIKMIQRSKEKSLWQHIFSAVGQIRQFAGEAAADIRELRQFLKKEKALKLICLSLILVCWGLKIVYDDILLTVRS